MFTPAQLKRIRNIDWSAVGTVADDAHALQARAFLDHLAKHQLPSAYFARREVFGTTMRLPPAITSEIRALPVSIYPKLIVRKHLTICTLADAGNEVAGHMANLHDPLIKILETGGMLDLDTQKNLVVDGQWTYIITPNHGDMV